LALRPRCARAARCRGAAALFPACSSLAEQRCCARRVPPAAATALCARKREGVAGQAAREASRARVRSGCSSLHADCPGQASVAGRVHPGKPRHKAARRAICCTCLRAVLRPPTAVQPAPPPSDPEPAYAAFARVPLGPACGGQGDQHPGAVLLQGHCRHAIDCPHRRCAAACCAAACLPHGPPCFARARCA